MTEELSKIFMGLGLVHSQEYWLLSVIFDQWQKLHLSLDVLSNQKILKSIYYTVVVKRINFSGFHTISYSILFFCFVKKLSYLLVALQTFLVIKLFE